MLLITLYQAAPGLVHYLVKRFGDPPQVFGQPTFSIFGAVNTGDVPCKTQSNFATQVVTNNVTSAVLSLYQGIHLMLLLAFH